MVHEIELFEIYDFWHTFNWVQFFLCMWIIVGSIFLFLLLYFFYMNREVKITVYNVESVYQDLNMLILYATTMSPEEIYISLMTTIKKYCAIRIDTTFSGCTDSEFYDKIISYLKELKKENVQIDVERLVRHAESIKFAKIKDISQVHGDVECAKKIVGSFEKNLSIDKPGKLSIGMGIKKGLTK